MGKDLMLVLTVVAGLAGAGAVRAEDKTAVSIAVVLSEEQRVFHEAIDGFTAQLAARGYTAKIEIYELASAERAAASGASLVFTLGSAAATAHRGTVPAVFAVVGDPAGIDLMDSAHLPKGKTTGIGAWVPVRAQLAHVAAIAPDAKRIGVVISRAHSKAMLREMELDAQAFGFTLTFIEAATPNAVGVELAACADEVDALLALADGAIWTSASVKAAVIYALQNKKPLFGFSAAFTRAGALASISAEDYRDMGAQAADRAAAILGGAPIGELRILAPRKLSTSINLVVARRIGVEPSREEIDRAEAVFR